MSCVYSHLTQCLAVFCNSWSHGNPQILSYQYYKHATVVSKYFVALYIKKCRFSRIFLKKLSFV